MASIAALVNTLNTNSGSKTTGAFTPTANDLLVIVTYHTGNTDTTTAPTDNNADGLGTYTKLGQSQKVSSGDTMQVWARNALVGSATSTTATHNPGTSSGGGLAVFRLAGMTKTGSSSTEQAVAVQENQASGTPTVAMGQAVKTPSLLLGAVFSGNNPGGVTKPATFDTSEGNTGYNSPTTGINLTSDDGGNTDTTVTWGSSSATAYCALVVEFDPAAVNTKTYTSSALKQSQNVTKTHTTSALLKATVTKTHTSSALLQSQNVTKTHTTSALKQAVNVTKTFTTSALKQSQNVTKTFTTSALKQTQNITKTFTTSALLKATVTKTFTSSALLRGTPTKTHTTSALKQSVDVTRQQTSSALLQATTAKTHTTSTLAAVPGITHTTSALLKGPRSLVHSTSTWIRSGGVTRSATRATSVWSTARAAMHWGTTRARHGHFTETHIKAHTSSTFTTTPQLTAQAHFSTPGNYTLGESILAGLWRPQTRHHRSDCLIGVCPPGAIGVTPD